jgi:hypothetical protein
LKVSKFRFFLLSSIYHAYFLFFFQIHCHVRLCVFIKNPDIPPWIVFFMRFPTLIFSMIFSLFFQQIFSIHLDLSNPWISILKRSELLCQFYWFTYHSFHCFIISNLCISCQWEIFSHWMSFKSIIC